MQAMEMDLLAMDESRKRSAFSLGQHTGYRTFCPGPNTLHPIFWLCTACELSTSSVTKRVNKP